MCLFFESIKVLQGKPENLGLHEDRMNRTRSEFLGFTDRLSLENVLKTEAMSLQKCRVIYQEKIEKIEFIPYSPKIINHLRIVEEDDLQYGYKFLDRSCFDKMLLGIPPATVLLIIKNGKITDTTFANIAFWDGFSWLTPDEPLLAGTKRELLLRKGLIHKAEIRITDLRLFRFAVLINAMLDLDNSPVIDIRNIR